MIVVRLKLFAVAKQRAGADELELELAEPATVGQLRTALVVQVPELRDISSQLLFAVDAEYAGDSTPLSPDSDVACIPPVSGG